MFFPLLPSQVDGYLYAVGGEDDGGHAVASVECFDPGQDRWQYVSSLALPRTGHCAAVVSLTSSSAWGIVVAGGWVIQRLSVES